MTADGFLMHYSRLWDTKEECLSLGLNMERVSASRIDSRKIVPEEGGSIAEGCASYCAFLYSWKYKETCTLGMK